MKLNDKFIFFFSEIPSLKVRTKIINPSKPATFAAPKQTFKDRKGKEKQNPSEKKSLDFDAKKKRNHKEN